MWVEEMKLSPQIAADLLCMYIICMLNIIIIIIIIVSSFCVSHKMVSLQVNDRTSEQAYTKKILKILFSESYFLDSNSHSVYLIFFSSSSSSPLIRRRCRLSYLKVRIFNNGTCVLRNVQMRIGSKIRFCDATISLTIIIIIVLQSSLRK
jgi:hypothetical protein